MQMIRWNDDEIKTLAEEIARRRIADPIPSLTAIYHDVEAELLTPERRRGIATITLAPKLEAETKAAIEAAMLENSVQVPVMIPLVSEIKAAELAGMLTDAELIHEGVKRFQTMLAGISLNINRANISAVATPPPERIITLPLSGGNTAICKALAELKARNGQKCA